VRNHQRYFQQRSSQSWPESFQSASTALEAKATCATPCSSPGSFVVDECHAPLAYAHSVP
jgi:hypothetical protein